MATASTTPTNLLLILEWTSTSKMMDLKPWLGLNRYLRGRGADSVEYAFLSPSEKTLPNKLEDALSHHLRNNTYEELHITKTVLLDEALSPSTLVKIVSGMDTSRSWVIYHGDLSSRHYTPAGFHDQVILARDLADNTTRLNSTPKPSGVKVNDLLFWCGDGSLVDTPAARAAAPAARVAELLYQDKASISYQPFDVIFSASLKRSRDKLDTRRNVEQWTVWMTLLWINFVSLSHQLTGNLLWPMVTLVKNIFWVVLTSLLFLLVYAVNPLYLILSGVIRGVRLVEPGFLGGGEASDISNLYQAEMNKLFSNVNYHLRNLRFVNVPLSDPPARGDRFYPSLTDFVGSQLFNHGRAALSTQPHHVDADLLSTITEQLVPTLSGVAPSHQLGQAYSTPSLKLDRPYLSQLLKLRSKSQLVVLLNSNNLSGATFLTEKLTPTEIVLSIGPDTFEVGEQLVRGVTYHNFPRQRGMATVWSTLCCLVEMICFYTVVWRFNEFIFFSSLWWLIYTVWFLVSCGYYLAVLASQKCVVNPTKRGDGSPQDGEMEPHYTVRQHGWLLYILFTCLKGCVMGVLYLVNAKDDHLRIYHNYTPQGVGMYILTRSLFAHPLFFPLFALYSYYLKLFK